MPKNSIPNKERSKVRILFVEGDFAPGDLQELTQALASAVRPAQLTSRSAIPLRIGATPVNSAAQVESSEVPFQPELALTDDVPTPEEETTTTTPTRSANKPRVYRKPQPVNMDMRAGDTPFTEFAKLKAPESHRERYLVAAAWLHEHARIEEITSDHVFTCYKAAGWTFDIADPTVTFRQLKSEGLGTTKRGTFAINHLGIALVEKMNTQA